MMPLIKYPKTKHLQGSNLQIGDDRCKTPISAIFGKHVVIEEKMDGSNSAVSFSEDGDLLVQSRGHYLGDGKTKPHFDMLLATANRYRDQLFDMLDTRYIMYGEWLYAKHTIFYNFLPSYFMEFDIYDRETETFLDTPSRLSITTSVTGFDVVPVNVIYSGIVDDEGCMDAFVGRSDFITPSYFMEDFISACRDDDKRSQLEWGRTDTTGLMEGLYVKVEEDGVVTDRYKFVRSDFTQTALDSDHWDQRRITRNKLSCIRENIFGI